ncbi:MAG: dienelactone hydrolase family protein [Rhodocyclaceae bacterium]|nr:dienelactone hydrolase family protein [Rhodocyclaceae bacterium]
MTLAEFDSLVPAVPFSRRGFLVGSLAAGFTLAAGPVAAQTAIVTDTQGLTAGEIQVPTADGAMPAYRAQPAGVAHPPVILVVHEIFGVHEYIKDICRRLGKVGYLAIAPELYARYGDPAQLKNVQDALALAAKAADAQVTADLDACVAWAKANGGDTGRLGITGFCRGGRTVWLYAAHQPALKAAVAWYGPLDGAPNANMPRWPLDIAAELKAPVLGFYGGQDQGIPLSDVEAMRAAIAKAGGKSELRVYPDAGHAFHADYRPSYRKEAAEDAWQRMLAWFKAHGL